MAFRELFNSQTVDAADMNANFQFIRAGSTLPRDGTLLTTTDSALDLGGTSVRWDTVHGNVFDLDASITTANRDLWVLVDEVVLSVGSLKIDFTGLNGDDLETMMVLANGPMDDTGGTLHITFNNDTATTSYGNQLLQASNVTPGAARDVTVTGFPIYNQGNKAASRTVIYTKTGNERTGLTFSLTNSSGTTAAIIQMRASLWNNTASTITSLALVTGVTNATISAGTNVQLWGRK